MSDITLDQIVDRIGALTILEAAELKKMMEEKFDVSATPVFSGGVGFASAPAAAVEEQTEFTVMLLEVPADKKIGVIKEVRAITALGLKEAKDLVEAAPKEVVKDVTKDDAAKWAKQLEAAGAKVSVK